jgi:outer membrane protein OmpA-like peptidoglycan-associated protein
VAPAGPEPGATPPAAPPGTEGANPYTPESPELNPYFHPRADGGGSAPASAPLLELRCELVAKPRAGSVRGSVLSDKSAPIAGAQVELSGPSSHNVVTDGAGEFTVPSLGVGNYGVRVDADGYLIGFVSVDVKPGEQATPRVILAPKPKQAAVELTKQEVRIRKEIFFKTNSAEISEKSNSLLSEIADVLLRNPQVREVEVQGHTDNTGSPETNQVLSQQRAEAVRAALITAGVAEARLTAKGYGDSRPLVPNLTERNRARNRRVQFIIRSQD